MYMHQHRNMKIFFNLIKYRNFPRNKVFTTYYIWKLYLISLNIFRFFLIIKKINTLSRNCNFCFKKLIISKTTKGKFCYMVSEIISSKFCVFESFHKSFFFFIYYICGKCLKRFTSFIYILIAIKKKHYKNLCIAILYMVLRAEMCMISFSYVLIKFFSFFFFFWFHFQI